MRHVSIGVGHSAATRAGRFTADAASITGWTPVTSRCPAARLAETPQVSGGRLGRVGIDEASGAPFEAGDLRQARNNLDMPVIVVVLGNVKRQRVQKVIVGGWPMARSIRPITSRTSRESSPARQCPTRFKSRLLPPRRNPDLVRKPAGIGTEGDETLVVEDDSFAGACFLARSCPTRRRSSCK